MANLVEQLADFAGKVRFEDLPPGVVSETKRLILDCVACGLSGWVSQKGKFAAEVAREMGGRGEATILGSGPKVSALGAAFANGELINALDYDSLLTPPGHATPFVTPALMAVAEKARVSGKALLQAMAISHEVCLRMGRAMGYYRDPKNPQRQAVSGVSSTALGATLGVGKLMSLPVPALASAVGLAGRMAPAQSMAKWTKTTPLSMDKYLMAGWASEVPIIAVMLAAKGYAGDTTLLEGEFGFYRFMGSNKWDPSGLVTGLGSVWGFPQSTVYKYYPGCRVIHTALDCFYEIVAKEGLQPEEIESIFAYIDSHVIGDPAWENMNITSDIDAQMSVAYTFAVAAHRVPVGPKWFVPETWQDGRILGFMPKVKFAGHPDYYKALEKDPASRIGKVEVVARGKKYVGERTYRKGSPATPETFMTDKELEEKLGTCAAGVLSLSKVKKACEQVWTLEQMDDVSVFARNLAA